MPQVLCPVTFRASNRPVSSQIQLGAPDGQRLALQWGNGLQVATLDGRFAVIVPAAQPGPNDPSTIVDFDWSPDGSHLSILDALPDGGTSITLASADGSGCEELVAAPEDEIWNLLAWSRDGTVIAIAGDAVSHSAQAPEAASAVHHFVRLVEVEHPDELLAEFVIAPRLDPDAESARVAGLAWEPRGDRLAYLTGRQVFVVESPGQEAIVHGIRLPPGVRAITGFAWSPNPDRLAHYGLQIVPQMRSFRTHRTLRSSSSTRGVTLRRYN